MRNADSSVRPAVGDQLELEVVGIAHGGAGVGRVGAMVVFVEGVIPGERVVVRITRCKRRFAHAAVVRVITPSSERRTPRCRHVPVCGGCRWQHISYPQQLELKKRIVAEQLERIAGLDPGLVGEVVPSPREWQYRHTARLGVEQGQCGFRGRGSHRIVALEECPILAPAIEREVVGRNRRASTSSAPGSTGAGRNREVTIRADETGEVLAEKIILPGTDHRALEVSPGSFVQANLSAVPDLVQAVVHACGDDVASLRVVDCYAGVGLFAAALSNRGASVVAIEANPVAAADAARNLEETVEVVAGDVAVELGRFLGECDIVVLDPPRTGLEPPVRKILGADGPVRIVYVSCDPATLARDLGSLAAGYRTISVTPIDLFPQTPHIEAVALLRSR